MRVFTWVRRLLFAFAALTLGYCAFFLIDGWMFQNRERRELEEALQNRDDPANQPVSVSLFKKKALRKAPAVTPDKLIGRMDIQRLGLSVMLAEGTSDTTLRRAVGHIAATALPGQPGNIGVAGHRDTFFRPLRNILEDDVISLTTPSGEFQYRVVSAKVVGADDISVLDPGEEEILTLVTCYPFHFLGPAPERFVVRAERIMPRSDP